MSGQQKPSATSQEFNAKDYERPGLSEDEILQIKEAFDLFDVEGNGTVDPKELKASLASLGFDPKNQTISQIIMDLEAENTEGIEFPAFLDLMTARISDEDSPEDIKKVFNLFDRDRVGTISIENLRQVALELGEKVDDQELQEMIESADTDNDGLVTFDDFYHLIIKKAPGERARG